jgi:hypothetical protein
MLPLPSGYKKKLNMGKVVQIQEERHRTMALRKPIAVGRKVKEAKALKRVFSKSKKTGEIMALIEPLGVEGGQEKQ